MRRKRVTFQCDDLVLEGVVSLADGDNPSPAVVVCHPHPLRGGDMYNQMVIEVCREVEAKGLAALRFNFRGVGDSEGSHGQGIGEQDDLKAAISFLAGLPEIDKARIGVAGYSFGAGVGTRVAAVDDRVKAVAAISLPLRSFDAALLQGCAKPKLFIAGSEDQFIATDDLLKLVETLPDPKQCLIVGGADHFWFDDAEDVARKTAEFFSQTL